MHKRPAARQQLPVSSSFEALRPRLEHRCLLLTASQALIPKMPTPASAEGGILPQAAPKQSRLKRILVGLGAFLACIGIAYGAGRVQTQAQVHAAEQHANDLDAKRLAALHDLRAEHQKVQQLDARRHLHLSLLALEERNFGIAQSELAQSGKLLLDSAPAPNSDLGKLALEIQKHKLVATEDLSAQRQKLVGWARALDAAVP